MNSALKPLSVQELNTIVTRTWQAIGADVEQSAQDCGERLTNIGAIESCLDSSNSVPYGGMTEEQLSRIRAEGFNRVVTRTARLIRLV